MFLYSSGSCIYKVRGNFTVEDLRKSYENYGEANAFVLQLLIKSNSINTGAILVEETKEKPYLNPYINSIYSFCPSILFPGKDLWQVVVMVRLMDSLQD